MEEVLLFLLKQSAVVVALGVANWAQWKEKNELKADYKKLVEANADAMMKLSEANALEVKGLNENARERDNSTIEAIVENSNALGALHTIVKEVKDELK